MRFLRPLVTVSACLAICVGARANDAKHLVVEAGRAARQINNHPWAYTTPGQSNTACSTSGTVNGTATSYGSGTTNVNGTVDSNTSCETTTTPSQTYSGNRITVTNEAWVTDVASGDQYLLECVASWVGSKCSYLTGGRYDAELKGNNMWITGMRGMKKSTGKYHVLQFVRGNDAPISVPRAQTQTSTQQTALTQSSSFTPDELYALQTYLALSPEDKDYVRVFCTANPKGSAMLPRSKVNAGEPPDHALDCAAWNSAERK